MEAFGLQNKLLFGLVSKDDIEYQKVDLELRAPKTWKFQKYVLKIAFETVNLNVPR